jgi:hypothetical protein
VNEYELRLPSADGDGAAVGGSGDSGQGGSKDEASGETPALEPSEPPAVSEPSVVPATPQRQPHERKDASETTHRRYPRGDTVALGPVETEAATRAGVGSDGGGGAWGVLGTVAAVAAVLCAASIWRLRRRDAAEEG